MGWIFRLPRIGLVLLAVAAIVAGCVEASRTSGLGSFLSAGAGLGGYLLCFWVVVDGLPVRRAPDADGDEEEEGR